jgi:DNA-binding protein H-NS
MAKFNGLDKLSYPELVDLRGRVDKMMADKQNSARAELRQKITDLVKEQGLSVQDLFGKGNKTKGTVAVKYRDPKNPEHTWTGRGRMPRWMAAATKGGKAKKEDFLV